MRRLVGFTMGGDHRLKSACISTHSVLTICREHAAGQVQVEGLPESNFVISEKHMTMPQLVEYQKQGKLKEVFGSGTAAIVSAVNKWVDRMPPSCPCPVQTFTHVILITRIGYEGTDIPVPVGPSGLGNIAQAVLDRIQAIQTGKIDHPWSVIAGKAAN